MRTVIGLTVARERQRAARKRVKLPVKHRQFPQAEFTSAEDVKYKGAPMGACGHGEDWKMPSDAVSALWLAELEGLA